MNPADTLPTIVLQERVPAECPLAAADVEFLVARHSAHIEVVGGPRRGWYRLTSGGYVGSIVGPSCRVVIRPKVPLSSLFQLLDPEGPVRETEGETTAGAGDDAFAFLAIRLARLLTERAAVGLHRGYIEQTVRGPFVQGRLDVPAQLRSGGIARKELLHCRYDEFTADVPCNQVAKATAEQVRGSPLASAVIRAALTRSLESFAGVRASCLDAEAFAAAASPLAEGYRPLLAVCRLLADGLACDGDNSWRFPAFLIDMDRAFERYVTLAVARAFAGRQGYTVAPQPLYPGSRCVTGQPHLRIRPDMVVEKAGRPLLVVDAKWKFMDPSALVPPDVYQVVAYATVLGVDSAVLVYPGDSDRTWEYPLGCGRTRLRIHCLCVVGPREARARSLSRLQRILRHEARHSGRRHRRGVVAPKKRHSAVS